MAGTFLVALAVAVYLHGLGAVHILRNGDEPIYTQITRCTAASGSWLPLRSDMPQMVNTKPPLLFWQGMLSTDWGRDWSFMALRWPNVGWTFLTSALAGLLAWKIRGRDVSAGLLAAAVYLAFLSTYRYGRPFLTNAPETFWTTLCFFVMFWWRPRSFASRWLVPTLIGVIAGLAMLTKSFAQLLPIGLGLAAWHLHEIRHDDGSIDWRRLLTRSVPGLAWVAIVSLGMFSLWFLLDPDPAAIWREFVVQENLGKMKAGRPNYLLAVLWGRFSIWQYGMTWFSNAGVLVLPVLGTFIRGWQHRRHASREERLLWILLGVWFLVFFLPTQRSGRYLMPVMPMLAVLTAIHWQRLLPSAFLGTLAIAGVVLGLLAWISVALAMELGGVLPWEHWPMLVGSLALVAYGCIDRRRRAASAVASALCVSLAISSGQLAFEHPHGAYPPDVVARAAGRVVWVPRTFLGSEEFQRMLLPGADVRGYDVGTEPPIGVGEMRAVMQRLDEPPPSGAIGSRLEMHARLTTDECWGLASGRVAENLLRREWLVE
ncbi:MAG: ArnT family glycosyltransferase [Planctomycetia bacterium]